MFTELKLLELVSGGLWANLVVTSFPSLIMDLQSTIYIILTTFNFAPIIKKGMIDKCWHAVSLFQFIQLHCTPPIYDIDEYLYCSCWTSTIGNTGGEQEISLAAGCYRLKAAHEILHALGRYHEQSRPDRNNYVIINEDNIGNYQS